MNSIHPVKAKAQFSIVCIAENNFINNTKQSIAFIKSDSLENFVMKQNSLGHWGGANIAINKRVFKEL